MWSLYNQLLDQFPLQTEMATSSVLWFAGDVLAQKLEFKNKSPELSAPISTAVTSTSTLTTTTTTNSSIDWHRVGIQTIYAGIIWGVAGHYWYHWLDQQVSKLVPSIDDDNNISSKIRFVFTKLGLEMLLLHPISLLAFFVCVGLLRGDKMQDIVVQLQQDFKSTLLLEYLLWTPIDLCNFALVPVQHQLLVVNTACLLESIMLSFIKANGVVSFLTDNRKEEVDRKEKQGDKDANNEKKKKIACTNKKED